MAEKRWPVKFLLQYQESFLAAEEQRTVDANQLKRTTPERIIPLPTTEVAKLFFPLLFSTDTTMWDIIYLQQKANGTGI